MTRVLIAEDEPRIAAFLEKGFRANGFATAIARQFQQAGLLLDKPYLNPGASDRYRL
jgi:DNA-binding response OmpR family regulator